MGRVTLPKEGKGTRIRGWSVGGGDFWGGFGWIRPPPRDILGFLSLRVRWRREQRLPANSLKEFRCLAPGPAGDFYWRQKRKEKRQIRSRSGEEPERNKGTPKAAGLAEQRSRIPQFLINFSFLPLGPGPGGGQRFQGRRGKAAKPEPLPP